MIFSSVHGWPGTHSTSFPCLPRDGITGVDHHAASLDGAGVALGIQRTRQIHMATHLSRNIVQRRFCGFIRKNKLMNNESQVL